MTKKRDFIIKLAVIATLAMAVMLFIRNPLETHDRLNQALWNMGHLFFFALLGMLLLTQTSLARQSWQIKCLFSVLLSLLLGGIIEVIQYSIGRNMDFQDILQDMLGGVLGFLVVVFYLDESPVQRGTGRANLKKIALGTSLVVMVVLIAFYPVFKILLDKHRMQADLPLLAGFESSVELARWESDYVNRLELDQRIVKKGVSSLRVEFGVGSEYSDITLRALALDWRGYEWLNISIYNAQADNLAIELKIFDQQHLANGYAYSDRFNRPLRLLPGWNEIKVSLLDIQNAPQQRKIDLHNMAVITLFVQRPKRAQTIYLDNIHLSKVSE